MSFVDKFTSYRVPRSPKPLLILIRGDHASANGQVETLTRLICNVDDDDHKFSLS